MIEESEQKDFQEINGIVCALFSEVSDIPLENIDENTTMANIKIDSLGFLNVLLRAEIRFSVDIPKQLEDFFFSNTNAGKEHLQTGATVGDFTRLVLSAKSVAGGASINDATQRHGLTRRETHARHQLFPISIFGIDPSVTYRRPQGPTMESRTQGDPTSTFTLS